VNEGRQDFRASWTSVLSSRFLDACFMSSFHQRTRDRRQLDCNAAPQGYYLAQRWPFGDGSHFRGFSAPQEYLFIVRPSGPRCLLLLWVLRCPQGVAFRYATCCNRIICNYVNKKFLVNVCWCAQSYLPSLFRGVCQCGQNLNHNALVNIRG
jgi:hypothetical protein